MPPAENVNVLPPFQEPFELSKASDPSRNNKNIKRLQKLGLKVFFNHAKKNVGNSNADAGTTGSIGVGTGQALVDLVKGIFADDQSQVASYTNEEVYDN